jgi:hypothetical protein
MAYHIPESKMNLHFLLSISSIDKFQICRNVAVLCSFCVCTCAFSLLKTIASAFNDFQTRSTKIAICFDSSSSRLTKLSALISFLLQESRYYCLRQEWLDTREESQDTGIWLGRLSQAAASDMNGEPDNGNGCTDIFKAQGLEGLQIFLAYRQQDFGSFARGGKPRFQSRLWPAVTDSEGLRRYFCVSDRKHWQKGYHGYSRGRGGPWSDNPGPAASKVVFSTITKLVQFYCWSLVHHRAFNAHYHFSFDHMDLYCNENVSPSLTPSRQHHHRRSERACAAAVPKIKAKSQ